MNSISAITAAPMVFLPGMSRRKFSGVLAAGAGSILIGIESQKPANAFILEAIVYCFLTYGFGRAALDIAKNITNSREDVAGVGTAGSVNGKPRLMVTSGGNFDEAKFGINNIEASGIKQYFDDTMVKLFPNGNYGQAQDRDIALWKEALNDFGFKAQGDHILQKKPYVGTSGEASVIAGASTRFSDANGNYAGHAIPLVVTHGTQSPRFYKIPDPTRA